MTKSIEVSEEAGVRYLHFGSSLIQGAMRIARPNALELPYTRDMMVALLLRSGRRWPRNVLMIGLGSGSLAKFLYRHRPHASLIVVEIDAQVLAASRQFFKLPDDPKRLHIEIDDGVDYVARSGRSFDLILVDGFDAKGRAGMLDMQPFYCGARARLSDKGLLVANLLVRQRGTAASLERMSAAFDGRVHVLPRSEGGNSIAIAAAGDEVDLPIQQLSAAARSLQRETGLNLLPTIGRIKGEQDRFRL